MNKIAVFATALLLTVTTASLVSGASGNIRFTAHNLSSNNNSAAGLDVSQRHQYADNVDQVCIFCHTPHNASPSIPLWNKAMPTHSFNMYTSSVTLSATARAVTAPGPESLLCLSCHDGVTAINVLHNSRVSDAALGGEKMIKIGGVLTDTSNTGNAQALGLAYFGGFSPITYGANMGKVLNNRSGDSGNNYYAGSNLMDDHPISFSYTAAQGEKPTQLKDITSIDSRIRFFGPSRKLECSSCHDPHMAYGYDAWGYPTGVGNTDLKPFLVMDNIGSKLCLQCHNK